MKNLLSPLNDAELDQLGQFLLDRIDEDTDTEGRDEGVLDVSELDGLFTAIVSGPVSIQPSRWLPEVWGDFEPEWESTEEFDTIFSMMTRHMNGIVAALMQQPEDFEPLFLEHEVEGKTYRIVDEWCHGYMRGVSLSADQWDLEDLSQKMLLIPMMTFASEQGWEELGGFSDLEIENIQNTIAPNVREIHAYWLARRQEIIHSDLPFRHTSPQIGRNDPCPCGSGKKFKKCCLQ